MASTPKKDLISELERRYLECNVCTEIFNEDDQLPRLLPCQHTFCSLCLKKLRIKESIKCPSCNALHKLGKRGIIEFPKDNIRRDLTSFLQAQDGISAEPLRCSKCNNSIRIEACYICSQCNVSFCNLCRNNHKKKKPSHELHLKSNDTKNKINHNVCQNSDHENASLKFFCTNCQIGICAICALNDHRDIRMHHLEDISQAFQERKASLTTSLDRLRQKILKIRFLQDKFADMDTLLKHQQLKLSEEINQQKQKHQANIMKRCKRKQQETLAIREKVSAFINNAEECYNLSEQIIESKNMTSFLHVHKTLEHHIKLFLDASIDNVVNIEALTNTKKDKDFKAFEDLVDVIENLTKKCGSDDTKEICQQNASGVCLVKQNVEQTPRNLAPKHMQKIRHEMAICIQRIKNGTAGCMKKVKHAFAFHNRRSNIANSEAVNHESKCWKVAKPILFIFVLLLCMHIPARYVLPKDFFTELKFSTHTWTSDFQCRSVDNKTVSLMAGVNMICGSPLRPITDNGVFANITFLPKIANDVEFTITVKNLTKKINFNWQVLFQFGLVENGSLDKYPNIYGHSCPYYAGICLNYNKDVDLTTQDMFTEKRVTTEIQGKFRVKSNPTDSSISVFTKSSKQPLYKVHKFRAIRLVFLAFKEFETFVTLTKKYPVSFDRSTLFPSLFISDDNKTVSTISTSLLKHKVKWKGKRAIFTAFDKAEIAGPDIRSVITIDVTDMLQSTKIELYEFGFGYFKKGKYDTLTKSKLIQDNTKSSRYYIQTGSTSTKLINLSLGSQFRMFVHYNVKKGAIVVSSNEYAQGGVFSYKLPYNYRSPVFFLRNINAHNIKAQWSKDAYIYEPILSYLVMYLN